MCICLIKFRVALVFDEHLGKRPQNKNEFVWSHSCHFHAFDLEMVGNL